MAIPNTVGIYLRQNAASGSDRPAETLPAQPPAQPEWQGFSVANWETMAEGQGQAGGGGRGGGAPALSGGLKVVTTRMRPGYMRRNGVPYSGNAVLTEFYDRTNEPNGDSWLILTSSLEDPMYLQVPYFVNPQLVRGFDYYNRTVFEIMVAEENPEQATVALGGGGRYDTLVEQLGGRPTPACGFGIGIERVILQMKAQNIEPKDDRSPDIFLAQLGDQARRKAFLLFEDLRASGVRASANFSKASRIFDISLAIGM